MLRYEPELFSQINFRHTEVMSITRQLAYSGNSICCPAAHFANIVRAKSAVVQSVSFNGGSTPLTAIKACIKAIGSRLNALSLNGEGLPNAITVKEISKACPSLTKLDLCMGGKGSPLTDDFELAIISLAKATPSLTLLRVPPCLTFGTFLGGPEKWEFVKRWSACEIPRSKGARGSTHFLADAPSVHPVVAHGRHAI